MEPVPHPEHRRPSFRPPPPVPPPIFNGPPPLPLKQQFSSSSSSPVPPPPPPTPVINTTISPSSPTSALSSSTLTPPNHRPLLSPQSSQTNNNNLHQEELNETKSPREKEPFVKGMGRRFSGFITKLLYSEEEPPPMEIGTPFNFQHIQHVKADPHTSTGFAVCFFLIYLNHNINIGIA